MTERGERCLHDVNRDAFASISSSKVFERRRTIDVEAANTLHVIVGTDSDLLVRWIAWQSLSEGSRVGVHGTAPDAQRSRAVVVVDGAA